MIHQNPPMVEFMESFNDQFEADNPNISIDMQVVNANDLGLSNQTRLTANDIDDVLLVRRSQCATKRALSARGQLGENTPLNGCTGVEVTVTNKPSGISGKRTFHIAIADAAFLGELKARHADLPVLWARKSGTVLRFPGSLQPEAVLEDALSVVLSLCRCRRRAARRRRLLSHLNKSVTRISNTAQYR